MTGKLCLGLAVSGWRSARWRQARRWPMSTVNLEEVASGLTAPMAMVSPPGDDRRFIVQQTGLIRILTPDGEILGEPFLDIRHKIMPLWPEFDEKGLLGLGVPSRTSPTTASSTSPTAGRPNGGAHLDKHFWWAHTNVVDEIHGLRGRSRRSGP